MPFPWKKAKGSRFSQLVAGHLHSSKRGGSLVVETGFPTSLVDLFVKNRDRMKKSRKKNRSPVGDSPPLNRPNSNDPSADLPTRRATKSTIFEEIVERDNPIPIVSSASVGGGRLASTAATILPIGEEIVKRDTPISVASSVGVGGGGGGGGGRLPIRSATNYPNDGEIVERDNPTPMVSSANVGGSGGAETGVVGLLMSSLKIVVVVGLALGTKRFVIWITLSAFVLFFLELVGKRLYRNRRFRVASDEHSNLKSVMQRAPCFDVIKPNDQLSIGRGEIQVVKFKSNSEQILSSGVSFDAANCNERLECEEELETTRDLEKEEEQRCKVPGLEHRHSRRAKMKSKMKKLVPKKVRKSKKICSNSKSEVSGSLQDDTCEQKEQYNIVELNCQEEQQALSTEFRGDGHARESSTREVEAIVVMEQIGRPSQRGSGYLVLCLIVLFGLIGGRMVALVLALSWLSILKILTGRLGKVPIVRSSANISD